MKLSELTTTVGVIVTNEEQRVLDILTGPEYIKNFQERERFVLENLIRKSLVSRVYYKGEAVVFPDDRYNTRNKST